MLYMKFVVLMDLWRIVIVLCWVVESKVIVVFYW